MRKGSLQRCSIVLVFDWLRRNWKRNAIYYLLQLHWHVLTKPSKPYGNGFVEGSNLWDAVKASKWIMRWEAVSCKNLSSLQIFLMVMVFRLLVLCVPPSCVYTYTFTKLVINLVYFLSSSRKCVSNLVCSACEWWDQRWKRCIDWFTLLHFALV